MKKPMLRDEDIEITVGLVTHTIMARRIDRPRMEIPDDESWEVRFSVWQPITIADIKKAFEKGAAFRDGIRGDDPQVHRQAHSHSGSEHQD
jgi:hypothetical protein